RTVAYPVHEFGARDVDYELHRKIHGDEQCYLGKRDAEFALKGDKEQGGEVVDYRLTDIPRKTSGERRFMTDRNNTNQPQSKSFWRFCTAETCQYVYYCLRSARAKSSENLLL